MSVAEKLQTIAENEQKVYDAGKKSEHDEFWDCYQNKGKRTTYYRAFYGQGFCSKNFYPKYDICPVGDTTQIFYAWETINTGTKFSLKERLEECGVVLDTSKATSLSSAFAYNKIITEIPTIDVTGLTTSSTVVFGHSSDTLKTIEKIITKDSVTYVWWFTTLPRLANITIEGVIGRTFDISSSSVLTADSAKSIITHLKNYKGTENELTYSVLFHANVWAKLDAEGNASPNGNTWAEYVDDLGWLT